MLSPAAELIDIPPFSLSQRVKELSLVPRLAQLTRHHLAACPLYADIVRRVFGSKKDMNMSALEDIPFLPVSLFKRHELKSVPAEGVLKVLTSSGTTGHQVSRIYLDSETARMQSSVLVKVVQHFLGRGRMPMIILDHAGVVRNRTSFSARGAGIIGMTQFGHQPFYALREDLSLDLDGLRNYVASAKGDRILLFGFTYMVFQGLIEALEATGEEVDLFRGILVHSGGWKKLQDRAVSAQTFRERLRATTGIQQVVNFYGMVEQVGGVFFENPLHYMHASIFSDVLIRDPHTLKVLPHGEVGLIQVLSCLPTSYPGHSLLTEDLGVIRGVDEPAIEMKGTYFEVLGRVPKAEIRGCSDTVQPIGVSS